MLLGYCKKDVTPLLKHLSYVFLALTHWYTVKHVFIYYDQGSHWCLFPGKVFTFEHGPSVLQKYLVLIVFFQKVQKSP